MLGSATYNLRSGPARWIQRAWGYGDIHTRQKWSAIWPFLAQAPLSGVRLLDAGCGSGRWALEIAARRPQWTVIGLDRDANQIETAKAGRLRLGLPNVSFVAGDFLEFQPARRFDIVLSVASAHYSAGEGHGDQLFRAFRTWLCPEGTLILLGPRRAAETPSVPFLGELPSTWGFGGDDLPGFCFRSGLSVQLLTPELGPLGTLAKRMAVSAGESLLAQICFYPAEVVLSCLDRRIPRAKRRLSATWLVVARNMPAQPCNTMQ